MDPQLADALLEAGIISSEQADRLREVLQARHEADWEKLGLRTSVGDAAGARDDR